MKILIYTYAFAPRIGGVETQVMHLARGLSNRGVEVIVVTPTPRGDFEDAKLSFRVIRRPSLFRFWKLIEWADILHLAGPVFIPLLMSILRRKPVVVEHHGYQAICPNGLLLYEPTKTACPGFFMQRQYVKCLRCNAKIMGWMKSLRMLGLTFLRRWLCRKATVNVPITHHVDQKLHLPRSRVIYYGVPAYTVIKHSPEQTDHVPKFGYIGRLVSEKGLPLLLEAAQRLWQEGHEFRLWFVGDGPERPHLEAMAKKSRQRERIWFTGYQIGEALQRIVDQVDVVVMPSICEETAGLAAIEHMMRGRLVIAADIGGLGEVVGNVGLKFNAGDREGLLRKMRMVLEEPLLIEKLGIQARIRASKIFGIQRMVNKHMDLYRACLNNITH